MCIEGLFYESRIKPIEPPDIFGIVIDGERHSKPRIFTQVSFSDPNKAFCGRLISLLRLLVDGPSTIAIWLHIPDRELGCFY